MQHCAEAWLVSLEYELPTDPSVAYDGGDPIVGCNHLVCKRCGAEVRHADHRAVPALYPPEDLKDLYESPAPESSPLLDARPLHKDSRAYFCRCSWYGCELSGGKDTETMDDHEWRCAGHPDKDSPEHKQHVERAARIAKAEAETAPLRQQGAEIAAIQNAKIRFTYGNVHPEFTTATGLRDALLASWPDAGYFNAPVVGKGRDDTMPAWGWAIELIHRRTDWWPALGIALQHAVKDGGAYAQRAFATLLADYRDSLALLPWTEPLAAEFPDATAPGSGTGWGVPDWRAETIIADQKKSLVEMSGEGADEAFLDEYGAGGKPITGPFRNADDLRALLIKSAHAGQFPNGTEGPWSWLGFEIITAPAWFRPALDRVIHTLDLSDDRVLRALLDWFSEERDLWRYIDLMTGWVNQTPSWWGDAANTKPSGWRYNMRSAHWSGVATLGDVATEALRRAALQAATPPVEDLTQLYGAHIS